MKNRILLWIGLAAALLLFPAWSNQGGVDFDCCSSRVDVRIPPSLAIDGYPPPPEATEGVAYSAQFTTHNGEAPFQWSLDSGALPAGLALDADAGTLSDTPSAAGSSTFMLKVVDGGGHTARREFTLTVNPPPAVATSSLPWGVQGVDYAANLFPSGGSAPFAWSLVSGSLPSGLSLDGSCGRIAGAPSAAGTPSFTVRVEDAWGATAERSLSLEVRVDPGTFPRLVVAGGGASPGVRIWNNAGALAADRACDATLGDLTTADALRMALHGNRLFAATSGLDSIVVWDEAMALSDGSPSAAAVPVSVFGGTPLADVPALFVDEAGHLWVLSRSLRVFWDARSLTGASTPRARYRHPDNLPLTAAVRMLPGDHLVAGSVAAVEVVAWHRPMERTGDDNPATLILPDMGQPSSMAGSGSRLSVGSRDTDLRAGYVTLWPDAATGLGTTSPVLLGAASGLGPVVHVDDRRDVLVATVSEGALSRVCLYVGASALAGERAPDVQVSGSAMVSPRKALLAKDGSLYVLEADGILVFRNALSSPVLACKLSTGISEPKDFLLME